MAAMGLIQKFNINPEVIQKIVAMLMSDPQALQELAERAGVSKDMMDQVKGNFQIPTDPHKKD